MPLAEAAKRGYFRHYPFMGTPRWEFTVCVTRDDDGAAAQTKITSLLIHTSVSAFVKATPRECRVMLPDMLVNAWRQTLEDDISCLSSTEIIVPALIDICTRRITMTTANPLLNPACGDQVDVDHAFLIEEESGARRGVLLDRFYTAAEQCYGRMACVACAVIFDVATQTAKKVVKAMCRGDFTRFDPDIQTGRLFTFENVRVKHVYGSEPIARIKIFPVSSAIEPRLREFYAEEYRNARYGKKLCPLYAGI